MNTPTAATEPVRLRGWVAVAVSAAVTFALAVLGGADWPVALAGAILTVAPMVGGIEWQRSGAWSPVSVHRVTTAAAQIASRRPEENVPPPDRLLALSDAGGRLYPEGHRYTYPQE